MKLYLVTESPVAQPDSLEVEGRYWCLEMFDTSQISPKDLNFLCISYTWGPTREQSPFHAGFEVSDRTIPALRSAIRTKPTYTKIWIDAFCVPQEPRERFQCLESMGYIYAIAREVLAVLSPAARPALELVAKNEPLDRESMVILEREDWVARAWTYQEAVNTGHLDITSEGALGPTVHVLSLVNSAGYSLRHTGLPPLKMRAAWPRLDALENLAEYYMGLYQERSALEVMGRMDWRTQGRPEDHFFAMIGVISKAPASSAGTDDPCESFMSLCEQAGDYSFIYSAAPRCDVPGSRWRPVSGDLPAILPWHCSGASQPGRRDGDSLVLFNVINMTQGELCEEASRFLSVWLSHVGARDENSKCPLEGAVSDALQLMGFRGSSKHWVVPMGLFFALDDLDSVDAFVVCSTVIWTFGAPGLALSKTGGYVTYSPGVFAGVVKAESSVPSVRLS